MKDLRDEIALGASNEDLDAYEFSWEESSNLSVIGVFKTRAMSRAEARYAYADAMMAARSKMVEKGAK